LRIADLGRIASRFEQVINGCFAAVYSDSFGHRSAFILILLRGLAGLSSARKRSRRLVAFGSASGSVSGGGAAGAGDGVASWRLHFGKQ